MGVQCLITNGYQVLYAPDGDKFLMPVGGDVNVYLRKGFRAATVDNPIPSFREPLKDGEWEGRRCFIVSGGPSLKGFDWDLLRGELTIGVNRAVEYFDPTVSLSIDARWYEWTTSGKLGEEAKLRYGAFNGHKVMVCGEADKAYNYPATVQSIAGYPGGHRLSPALRFGLGHGDNSGLAALNLALCLGASQIYLLGFDCNPNTDTQEHFHDGYPEMQRGCVYKKFIASFNLIAEEAKKRAKIINVNEKSGLKCFDLGRLPGDILPIPKTRRPTMPVHRYRSPFRIVRDGIWTGKRCFIIGGGPSLKGFDWSKLKGELTIGINRVYEHISPSIIFSIDSRFWQWIITGKYGEEAKHKFLNSGSFKVWVKSGRGVAVQGVLMLECVGIDGLTQHLEDGLYTGNNSGYAAINLAVGLGCKEIYLLGFDMRSRPGGRQQWFHSGHPFEEENDAYPMFLDHFNKLAPLLKEHGVQVTNLTPDSALTCFKKSRKFPYKKQRPLVIGYYTKNTGYEQEIKTMVRSARLFGFEVEIHGIETLGGWQKNTYYKATFIRQMMKEHPRRPLLFLDADVVMRQYPDLFDKFDADIGISRVDWTKYKITSNQTMEINTSVIYLRNNARTRALLDEWIACNDKPESGVFEQKNLQNMLEADNRDKNGQASIKFLPDSYAQIFDLMNSAGDPVIELRQASRRFKQEVGA